MLLYLSLALFVSLVSAAVKASPSFPEPFELSFSDEAVKCDGPPFTKPRKMMKTNVSLCFDDLEDAVENVLNWKMMFTSFQLENKTAVVDLKVRRVLLFAPGASFTMAGSKPVSVVSQLRELEIGTHYNGYGEVSHSSNSSIIFRGQLNTTVFEGQIIYDLSLNRSHTIQCFHNNSLHPDFYQKGECIMCVFTTYDTHHNPDFPVGWRSNGHSPCNERSTSHSRQDTVRTQPAPDPDTMGEDSSDFPRTGFSDYDANTPDQTAPDLRANASASSTGQTYDESDLSSKPSMLTQNNIAGSTTKISDIDATTHNATSVQETGKSRAIQDKDEIHTAHPSMGKRGADAESDQTSSKSGSMSPPKPSHSQDHGTNYREIETTNKKTFRRAPSSRLAAHSAQRSGLHSDKRRRRRKRNLSGTKHSRQRDTKYRTFRSASQQRQAHQPLNQSYTETISCPLHLVADHLFFTEIGEKSQAKTVNLMLSVVIGADAVFRATDFDGDGLRDNIGFMVSNITIIHNSSVAFYPYSRTNGNSFQYLKSFSTGDFSDVCLGVAFTAIDFQRGVVGLAWYASSLSGGAGKGGICGQRVYLPTEGSSFSFNTAIVSFLNHGDSLSMEKAILTLAHELGHCFGSTHDDMAGSPCNKAYPQGSYLMRKFRPSRFLPNSYKFSPCSLRQMYPVIVLKGTCFIRYTGPTCGNGVVEEGEECDCGLSGACQFNDPCCTPGDAPNTPGSDPPCTIRRSLGLECSPVTFSCCSDVCKHIGLADRYVCRKAGDCYRQASCDGQGAMCPVSSLLQDGTPCHRATRACLQGRCSQSLCTRAGLEPCFCQGRTEDLCKLCCRGSRHRDSRCKPASAFNITSPLGHVIYLPEGDGCLHYRGVCTASSDSLSKDQTTCTTTGDLDGEFSTLIGQQSDSKDPGMGWLYSSWMYLLLLLLLIPVLAAAALLHGRSAVCGMSCGSEVKGDNNNTTDNSDRGKVPAVLAGAWNQFDAWRRQKTNRSSALWGSRVCPRLPFQHQRRFQVQQAQRHHPDRPVGVSLPHYVRREEQTARENSNRPLNKNYSFCRHPEERRNLRTKKTGGLKKDGGYNLTQSLSLLESPSPQTSELSLLDSHRKHIPSVVAAPFLQRRAGFVNQCKRRGLGTAAQRGPVHHKVPASCRRLRANYSKPCIRTPLRRRRTLPTEASFRRAATRSTPVFNVTTGGRGERFNSGLNSNTLSNFTKSRQRRFKHNPLPSASSESIC